MADLKLVYKADTEELAMSAMDDHRSGCMKG